MTPAAPATGLRSPWAGLSAGELPPGRSVPECWREVVAANKHRIALEIDGVTRTYAALDRDATLVARALLRLRHDAPIGYLADVSTDTVTALLGALLAGRVVLMLDPREPSAEHVRVCEFVDVTTVWDERDIASVVFRGDDGGPDLPTSLDPDTPSVLYLTSGTTGAPKVVGRTHDTMVIQSFDRIRMSKLTAGDCIGVANPLAFGASAVPLFAALFSGSTATVYDVGRRGVDAIPKWLRDQDVKRSSFVPSLVRALATYDGPPVECLRAVSLGGEAVSAADAAVMQRVFPNADVYCTFGAGESGTVAAAYLPRGNPVEGFDALFVMPDQQVAIVGPDGKELADGETGEIVVTGPCVAHGYWGDPPEYAGVFSTAPDGTRSARPGDRGRFLPDGRLQLAGRVDHRIKVRGQGVDLAGLEVLLAGLDSVREAMVSAVDGPGGATQLVAHVVIEGDEPIAARDLRRGLADQVPGYAIPTRFRFTDSLPRTGRDKVDRQALARDAAALVSEPVKYVPPRDDIDARIAALFAEVLALDEVGLRHDFFELGGDSLGALELLVALESEFRVNARDLATQPGLFQDRATVEALGDLVRARSAADDHDVVDSVTIRLTAPGVDAGPPVFLIPGIGANAVQVRGLALRLDGRRVYSFWPQGMLRPGWPDCRLEVMAARYAHAIRTAEPDGPVVVGGYSFGAHLAFEVALALQAAGCPPALVVTIDTPTKGFRPREVRTEQYAARVRAASNVERLRILAGSVEWRAKVAYRRATVGVLPRKLSNQFEAYRAHHERMLRRYEPSGTYDGAVLVLSSDDHGPDDTDLGWGELVTGPVTVVRVAGIHERLLREPWVGAIARAINDAITNGVRVAARRAGTH